MLKQEWSRFEFFSSLNHFCDGKVVSRAQACLISALRFVVVVVVVYYVYNLKHGCFYMITGCTFMVNLKEKS